MNPAASTAPYPTPDPAFRHDAVWHVSGTPQERLARVAARRAFVEMKQCFLDAAADFTGSQAVWLRHQLRQAPDVQALWQLHRAVFAALPCDTERGSHWRDQLRQQLEAAFPDAGGDTEFAPL
jgi:hypothetical protein